MIKLQYLLGMLLLMASSLAFADGPCPDGQFNPNNSVCMCPGGGYVAPNTYCNRGSSPSAGNISWGAIALDLRDYRAAGFSWSDGGQAAAIKDALNKCRYDTCKIALTFQNSCGAIAIQYGGGPYGKGVSSTRAEAERRAVANCTKNGGKQCTIWVKASCAGSPK